MAGLVLKMAPKERVLINGAVLENGDRRSRFSIVSPSANVLRLKDAIPPDEANTPVGRLCYQLQLVLSGHSEGEVQKQPILDQVDKLSTILRDSASQVQLSRAKTALAEDKFYSALKSVRSLLPLEKALLGL